MQKSLLLAISFVICLAGCEIDGDVSPSALGEGGLSDPPSAKGRGKRQDGKETPAPSLLDEVLELQSGICGIPFGATTDEIVKWCTDNHIVIANPTEEDVKEDLKRALRRIRDLKEAYDFEIAFLTPLERELLKLAQGYADMGEVLELAKVAAAKEKLDILKNPSFSYEGRKYYLAQLHKGLNVEVDGKKAICRDERITNATFGLVLTPTEKSEKLLANGITEIGVFFHLDTDESRANASKF